MASSWSSSSPPAKHLWMLCSSLVWPAPSLLSFPLNKIASQSLFSPVNLFPPLSRPRSRLIYSRSGDIIDGSRLWWDMGTRSRRIARDFVPTVCVLLAFREEASILGALMPGRYDLCSPSWSQRLSVLCACLFAAGGSHSSAPCAGELKVVVVGSLASCGLVCANARDCLHYSFMLIAWSGEIGVEDRGLCSGTQILSVNWKMADLRFVVVLSELQNRCCSVHVPFCILKLAIRGVKCVTLECYFCILEMRADDNLAKDGGSCSFGSIHRWQVREPLLLIPRYSERGSLRLSSVLRPRNLQLIHLLPLVHPPARLPGESLALWRASTKEALEDFSCGCVSDISQLTRHMTSVVVFPVFSLLLIALVIRVCKVAPVYALFSRVL